MLIPSSLDFEWRGADISITLDTEYPFKNRLSYTVKTSERVEMPFKIRIPSFAKNLTVNGKKLRNNGYVEFSGFDSGVTKIDISFDTEARLAPSPTRGLYNVSCGSLIFSAKIEAEYTRREYISNSVERKYPYCDYLITPKSDWNFAFASRELKVNRGDLDDIPFSSQRPPITVEAQLCHIDWRNEFGYLNVCAKKPHSKQALDEPFAVELYPYGCVKLRMTEMPIADFTKR